MSTKTRNVVIAVMLAISVVMNVVFFVLARIQKAAAENQLELVLELKEQMIKVENDCRAREDAANALRYQAETARNACEEKLISFSKKGK